VLVIFTLGERPTLHLAGALVLTTVGVVLVLGGGELHLGLGWGELAGLLSSVFGAAAVAAIRAARLPGGDRPAANTVTVFFALTVGGLIVAWPFALQAWPTAAALWGLALGAAVASLGAQLLMTHALGFLAIPEASIWQQLAPVMSFLWGAVLLAEPVRAATIAGVATAGLGVVYGAVLGRGEKPRL
jgi:drug/metabolite transporter (DMT)-like permease